MLSLRHYAGLFINQRISLAGGHVIKGKPAGRAAARHSVQMTPRFPMLAVLLGLSASMLVDGRKSYHNQVCSSVDPVCRVSYAAV